MRDAAWQDWYRAQHDLRCRAHGDDFEEYVTAVLEAFHPDFINPSPAGSLGDGGADGLASGGSILYACYGQRAIQNAEQKLHDKMKSDFERALSQWPVFVDWRFVTNASPGPKATAYLVAIQNQYGTGKEREITPAIWSPEKLWRKIVSKLDTEALDWLLPGVPRALNVELIDLVPLLEELSVRPSRTATSQSIRPVPLGKVSFNNLPVDAQLELNEGRLIAHRIDRWFSEASDPDLRDTAGETFRELYEAQERVTSNPREILERIYTSLAGSDFRYDSARANAAYAVTSYFFDSCHIFKEPPQNYIPEVEHATAH
jgi:hypothetical protein